jgi:diguanylate cyclase (GGDEF)-like protein
MVNKKIYSDRLHALLSVARNSGTSPAGGWAELESAHGPEIYAEALYQLTRLNFEPREAKVCWMGILAHQDVLRRQLGRNVSLITAVADYFLSVRPTVKEPILVELVMLRQSEEGVFRDELTGLYNRRYLNQELPSEMERFRRFGHPFSLLMLDLDHFKRVNDTYGHQAGDQVLRDLSGVLQQTARLYDRAVRYGGEEFVIILPQVSREEAVVAAERIREAVAAHEFRYKDQDLGRLTVSIGAATYPMDAMNAEALVSRADQALYQAKETRNAVVAYQDSKRRHIRFRLDVPLNLRAMGRENRFIQGRVKNISFGGMLCEADTSALKDNLLEVIISDPGRGARFFTLASVRRVERSGEGGFELGLSFELGTPEEQKALLTLIEEQADTRAA